MLREPGWLLLALPMAILWWYWRQPSNWAQALRGVTLILVFLSLAGLSLPRQRSEGTVIVVADRSSSMPAGIDERHKEVFELLRRSRRGNERIGVVAFGKQPVVEQMPSEAPFAGFVHEVDADGSALAAALDKSLELIPQNHPARILVLSDGRWTGVDPLTLVNRFAARKIPVDYRLMRRPTTGDLAVTAVDVPASVPAGTGFFVSAWLNVPEPQKVRTELVVGDTVIGSLDKQFPAGRHRVVFRALGREPQTIEYRLRAYGEHADPVPENNTARLLVQVSGYRTVLHVADQPGGGLAQLLQQAGFQVASRKPEECLWNLEQLSQYAAVILENVSADAIGIVGLNLLAHWVRDAGGGLVMTGGRNSYAMGGYYGSPLAEVLPVSLEMREEHRKFSVAIVVVLDRSGSMMAPVSGGKVKMDLANLGTAQVLELLSPLDELGVIAVDSSPHIIAPLQNAKDKGELRRRILSIQSMGGGIFVYTGLVEAARMIQGAKAATRHIILFADAADAEEPGDYQRLIAALRQAGVTISVIGLGKPTDVDAEFLRDIARRGDGSIYFTDQAEQLPLLFAQDTFKVARSTFIEEVTPVAAERGLLTLTPRAFSFPEPVGGYNLCYLRPEAVRAAVTQDEFRAPLVAAWQRGLGRVVCYTGEVDGKHTGPIARWSEYGDFLVSLARWATGTNQELPGDMAVTQDMIRGAARMRLYVDPEREQPPVSQPPQVIVLRQRPDGRVEREEHRFSWVQADILELQLPLTSTDTVLATVNVPGHGPVSLPPACLPYSSEHELATERDVDTLAQLALATGGTERADLTTIWRDLPTVRVYRPFRPWLLSAALVTLLLEILERRTGWLTVLGKWIGIHGMAAAWVRASGVVRKLRSLPAGMWRRPTATTATSTPAVTTDTTTAAADTHEQPVAPVKPQPTAAAAPTRADSPLLSALEKARRRSQRQIHAD